MEITQVAKFFDRAWFDTYVNGTWHAKTFMGQLKLADQFVSIWNRPTRKRMLSTHPNQTPSAKVIRLSATGDVYLLGTRHSDHSLGEHYRDVTNLHSPRGLASVVRRTPQGPPNDPGWAVSVALPGAYADTELRSVNEDQNRQISSYGNFFLFSHLDSGLQKHDSVTLSGTTYFLIETYEDSGFLTARATSRPDERIDMLYVSVGTPVYDPATLSNAPVGTTYNVTAKFTLATSDEEGSSNVLKESGRLMISRAFIGVEPKAGDKAVISGRTYRVAEVASNAIDTEWYLKVEL